MARKNVSGRELGRRLNENSDWISRRTSGKTPLTTVDMERIASALGSPLGKLVERALSPQYVPRNVQILGKNRRSGPRTTICADRKDISSKPARQS